MSQLLLEVPDQKTQKKEELLVEVDKVPCEPTDTTCIKRLIESNSDCV